MVVVPEINFAGDTKIPISKKLPHITFQKMDAVVIRSQRQQNNLLIWNIIVIGKQTCVC